MTSYIGKNGMIYVFFELPHTLFLYKLSRCYKEIRAHSFDKDEAFLSKRDCWFLTKLVKAVLLKDSFLA